MAGRYFELVERAIDIRGNIVELNDNILKKLNVKIDYPAWSSMFIFSDDILEHTKNQIDAGEAQSVIGYKGKVSANYLWIDVDTKEDNTEDVRMNIMSVIKHTKTLINNIMLNYELDEKSFKIYFSGNKGFHIGIPVMCFGAEGFVSEAIPTIFKIMAKEITNNSKFVDYKIFNTTRIFRLPHSIHNASGLYKVIVSLQTIQNLDAEKIIENAKQCIDEKVEFNPVFNTKLSAIFEKCCGKSVNSFDLLETVSSDKNNTNNNKTLFRLPKKGERNESLFKMAVKLFTIPQQYLSNDMVV